MSYQSCVCALHAMQLLPKRVAAVCSEDDDICSFCRVLGERASRRRDAWDGMGDVLSGTDRARRLSRSLCGPITPACCCRIAGSRPDGGPSASGGES